MEGRAAATSIDTVQAAPALNIDPAHWTLREHAAPDFWTNIAVLDVAGAERTARGVDERTFVLALRSLLDGDAESGAIAFAGLRTTASDAVVRQRARTGLTIALSWRGDWEALARIGPASDSAAEADSVANLAAVEKWGEAFAGMPAAVVMIPDVATVVPLRRSAFGTPVIEVVVNGRAYEFWLDTGASMTVLSADVAIAAGVALAAPDTLALGVTNGQIAARAIIVDTLAIGGIRLHSMAAAVVNSGVLRLDRRIEHGLTTSVPIAGVLGMDVLRHLDVVLDAGAGTATFRRPRRDPRVARNLFWIGYPVVRLALPSGRPVLFGLDTGAEATYVTTTLLRKQPGTPVAVRRSSLGGLGTETQMTDWVARVVTVSDGAHAMRLRDLAVAPARRWTFVDFDGIIGADVALASRLHLDLTNGVFDVTRSARDLDGRGPTVTVGPP